MPGPAGAYGWETEISVCKAFIVLSDSCTTWSHPEILILMIETDNTELSTTNALKCPQFFPLQKYRVAMAAASAAISSPMHVIIVIIIIDAKCFIKKNCSI